MSWKVERFELSPTCAGCGYEHVGDATLVRQYHNLPNPNDPEPICGLDKPHMHNRCKRCNYEWASKMAREK